MVIDIFFTKSNFPIRILHHLKEINFQNFSENEIRLMLIIILGIGYYYVIFSITQQLFVKIISHKKNISKKLKYKLQIFIPIKNIYIVYILKKKMLNIA